MDFDDAVKAHSAWKMKLSSYLHKPDGSLKPADIEVDDKCALGQWIHGDGAKFGALPEYGLLKSAHAKFHKSAAQVVRSADSGANVTEVIAVGGKSDFAQASMAVVSSIMKMKSKADGK